MGKHSCCRNGAGRVHLLPIDMLIVKVGSTMDDHRVDLGSELQKLYA